MRRLHLMALGLLTAVLAAWAGAMAVAIADARLPDKASGKVLAVFSPSSPPEQAFAAMIAAGALPMRQVLPFVWIAQGQEAGLARRLRAHGAKGVYGAFTFGPRLAGCFAYAGSRPKPPPNLLR
jgi:hypothetical protein